MGEQRFPLQYPLHLNSSQDQPQPITNKIIYEQLFTQYNEYYEVFEYEPVINAVTMKTVSGYPIPFLIVSNSENQKYTIPLFGIIYLSLLERTCVYCGTTISSDKYSPICEQCSTTELLYGQQCRFDGPGAPFGKKCDPKNPPCSYLEGPKGCFNKHYVYIASIGSKIKVGISSEKRSQGIYTRLLEQGIRKAIVIRSFNNLHEAMEAEGKISQELGLPKKITLSEKTTAIVEEDEPIHQPDHGINKTMRQMFPDKKIISLNLFQKPSFLENKTIIAQKIAPPILDAEIVYSLGKILLMTMPPSSNVDEEDTLIMLNSEKLVGYKIEVPEIT